MRVVGALLLLAAGCIDWVAGYYTGKAKGEARCPQAIGYAEPQPGMCKAYAVSDKTPGAVTPVWLPCPVEKIPASSTPKPLLMVQGERCTVTETGAQYLAICEQIKP